MGLSGRWSVVAAVMVLLAVACGGDDAADPGPVPAEVASALCAASAVPSDPGATLRSTTLTELSGLVAGRRSTGIWWAVNDSGNEGRLHVVGPAGEDGGTVAVDGAANVDWEDLAAGPGPEGDLLYIADIGNNIGDRVTVPIDVVTEPDAVAGLPPSIPVERSIELTWPDGARDAETLLVDPRTSALVIFTKSYTGPAEVYVADGTGVGPTPMTKVGTVDLRAAAAVPADDAPINVVLGLGAPTGGSVTEAGDVALVRTYGTALAWPRNEDQSLAEAIVDNEPCEVPTAFEEQGEAIAVDPDGGGYRTIGEGRQAPVNRFESARPG